MKTLPIYTDVKLYFNLLHKLYLLFPELMILNKGSSILNIQFILAQGYLSTKKNEYAMNKLWFYASCQND